MYQMKKLTKSQVTALTKKHGSLLIELYPSNCSPANQTWVKGFQVSLFIQDNQVVATDEQDPTGVQPFDQIISEFMYYNCNRELGVRVHCYTKQDQ